MLPRETSIRQLKKLRSETKGTDIGDITAGDRLNHNVPNLQYISNPVDTGIESWDEFSKKDSKLQTIAFKSKLVNKPLVKENNYKNMKENKILKLEDFGKPKPKNILKEELDKTYNQANKNIYSFSDYEDENFLDPDEINDEENFLDPDEINNEPDFLEEEEQDGMPGERDRNDHPIPSVDPFGFNKPLPIDELTSDDDDDILAEPINEEEPNIKKFESFKLKEVSTKEEKQPEYTMLGKEKELKSNPNFGIGAVKAQEIKKITDFNLIDPPTPRERTIGGNAGVFIENDTVKGFVNRIEGKNVYIESADEPMVIKKFNIKDVVKTKK